MSIKITKFTGFVQKLEKAWEVISVVFANRLIGSKPRTFGDYNRNQRQKYETVINPSFIFSQCTISWVSFVLNFHNIYAEGYDWCSHTYHPTESLLSLGWHVLYYQRL